jgi:hypothetical protein
MGRLIDIAATLLSIGAGLYLLQYSSPGQSSWFEVIGHGMGVYFIAKGLFMARSLHLADQHAGYLAQLVELSTPDGQDTDG